MEYYLAIKTNEIMPFVYSNMDGLRDYHANWIKTDKGNIILYHSYVESIKKNDTNELTRKTEILRLGNQTHGYQRGKGGEEGYI